MLLESFLNGPEVSLFCVVDGDVVVPLLPAQDFKRVGDGDTGPNTGGMGAYAPLPWLPEDVLNSIVDDVVKPVAAELVKRGCPFSGLLYAGLSITSAGPAVVEFNCRFGDPETQAVVPLVEGDLLEALAAAARGDVSGVELGSVSDAAVTVVLAAEKYPAESDRGGVIEGVDSAEAMGALVFHAGTARHGDRLVTNGGRILAVTGRGPSLAGARAAAYDAVGRISFPGMRCRSDIAEAAASGAGVVVTGGA